MEAREFHAGVTRLHPEHTRRMTVQQNKQEGKSCGSRDDSAEMVPPVPEA